MKHSSDHLILTAFLVLMVAACQWPATSQLDSPLDQKSPSYVAPPGAPTGVGVASGNGQAVISWAAVTGATAYNLYYSTMSSVGTSGATKVAGATSPYTLPGLTNGTTYYFVLTAVNAGGESVASTQASVLPQVPLPGAPTGVTAVAGVGQVTVSWTAVNGATSYNLYYSTTSGVTVSTGTKVTAVTSPSVVTSLAAGTPYYVIVTAVNASGEVASNQASATTTPQYSLTIAAGTGGTVNPSGTTTVSAGIATNIVATPDTGLAFSTWSILSGSPTLGSTNNASTTVTLLGGGAAIQANFGAKITNVAGNGTAGYSGDNGLAASALLNLPCGLAFDASGNLYVADRVNNRIRKVSTSGVITTVAGNGTAGYSGDNGSAILAELWEPFGISIDSTGILYIADTFNNCIRKVSSGVITTVVGTGTAGFGGDGGSAVSAQLNTPFGVAVDSSGNLYIADTVNNRIRKVSSGVISTVAGNGTSGYSGDNSAATSAELSSPFGVAIDPVGFLYIADTSNNRIRRVASGVITTVAGNGTAGYGGDNGAAASALLNHPYGLTFASSGNFYIADYGNNRIRRVSGVNISTVVGNGTAGYSGDNGTAVLAALSAPRSLVFDSSGNLFISDSSNNSIREVTGLGGGMGP